MVSITRGAEAPSGLGRRARRSAGFVVLRALPVRVRVLRIRAARQRRPSHEPAAGDGVPARGACSHGGLLARGARQHRDRDVHRQQLDAAVQLPSSPRWRRRRPGDRERRHRTAAVLRTGTDHGRSDARVLADADGGHAGGGERPRDRGDLVPGQYEADEHRRHPAGHGGGRLARREPGSGTSARGSDVADVPDGTTRQASVGPGQGRPPHEHRQRRKTRRALAAR